MERPPSLAGRGRWFVATIGLFVLSLPLGGIDAGDANGNPNEEKVEASEAYDVFNAGGTTEPPYERFLVVVEAGPGAATDPGFQATVGDLVAALGAARPSWTAPTATFIS